MEQNMNHFTDRYRSRLENFAAMSQAVGSRNDYIQGGGGNTSAKLDGELMAIKASGYCLSDIRADHAYAVLDYAALSAFYMSSQPGDFEDAEKEGAARAKLATRPVEGLAQLRPSVEAGFHSILKTYVVHSHSVYANMAACAAQCRAIAAAALADAGYAWGHVKYTDPGARLTFSIRDELARVKAQTGEEPAVLLMGNHGLIVHHDDHAEALKIHEEVNGRIARAFGMTNRDFPRVVVREREDGLWVSDAPYLEAQLKSGRYGMGELCEQALYPDQLVFLTGTFLMGESGDRPEPGTCVAARDTGAIVFNMGASMAQTIAETLTAVVFIRESIEKNGYTLLTMGEAAKSFIANWESEKYRKSLAGK